jgi:hypothetical protein
MTMKRFLLALTFTFALLAQSFAIPIVITPANVIPSAAAQYYGGGVAIAGATITAGQAVYVDPSDKSIKIASATGLAAIHQVIGIAVNGASTGQPVSVVTKDPNFGLGGTVTNGEIVVLGLTGALDPCADITTGWFTGVMGVATDTSHINLFITRVDVAAP